MDAESVWGANPSEWGFHRSGRSWLHPPSRPEPRACSGRVTVLPSGAYAYDREARAHRPSGALVPGISEKLSWLRGKE